MVLERIMSTRKVKVIMASDNYIEGHKKLHDLFEKEGIY